MEKNIWLEGIMGLVVGDALGNPVQFMSREDIKNRKQGEHKGLVKGMEAGGAYDMPVGSWTDDSSMAIATMASILNCGEMDPGNVMLHFVKWLIKGEFTPFGEAYDIGNTCCEAILDFAQNGSIKSCGRTGEYSNGNGALMRIMPACLYYYERQKKVANNSEEAVNGIHLISGLTHNHLRSKMCCVLYYFMVESIIDGVTNYNTMKKHWDSLPEGVYGYPPIMPSLQELLQRGIDKGLRYYGTNIANLTEMAHLGRLFHLDEFKKTNVNDIKSSGYVVHSIEAAVWSLITTNSYKECLLKVVNLGDDTDSIGAIAGGLAALYYGYDAIPNEWKKVIQRKVWIEDMCNQLESHEYELDIPAVDIHMHCLFGVDDGASSPEMAMELIRSSYLQGIRTIMCTSHDTAYEYDDIKAKNAFEELKCRCASVMPDLRLYLGCEIYVEPEFMDSILDDLDKKELPSMNNSKYVLIEFPTGAFNFEKMSYCVDKLIEKGWIPVIAHAERYNKIIRGISEIKKLKDKGCRIQINSYSIMEEADTYIRELANALLDEKMVDFIGSDAHRTTHRPPKLLKGIREIYRRMDRDYADAICYQNAVDLFALN